LGSVEDPRGGRGEGNAGQDERPGVGQQPGDGREGAEDPDDSGDRALPDRSPVKEATETPGEGRVVDQQLPFNRGDPLLVVMAQHRDLPVVISTVPSHSRNRVGRTTTVTAARSES
jgi:hypothetical protein